MQEVEPLLIFVRRLNRLQLPHMVTGSAACIAYGVPRLTNDIDVVIEIEPQQIGFLKLECFREGGSEKHLRDIRGVLDVSRETLDWPELRKRIDEGGLKQAWSRVEELRL